MYFVIRKRLELYRRDWSMAGWFFNFDLEILKWVQNSIVLRAQIYLITNGLEGRQVLIFPELSSEKYKCWNYSWVS